MAARRIPLWLKILYTAWIAVWVPCYWDYYHWYNFLWFCDIACLVLCVAIWIESTLLFSWQAVSVLLVQVVWIVGYFGHLTVGGPALGTGYMFDADIPLYIRRLSFFHVAMPPMLLWGVRRLGYDRRAFWCQSALTQAILPLSWLLAPRYKDINWVWGPWDKEQHRLAPIPYLVLCMIAYPIVLYLPAHLFLRWWARRPSVDTPEQPR